MDLSLLSKITLEKGLLLILLGNLSLNEAEVGLRVQIKPLHYFYNLIILMDVLPTLGRDGVTRVSLKHESLLCVILLLRAMHELEEYSAQAPDIDSLVVRLLGDDHLWGTVPSGHHTAGKLPWLLFSLLIPIN